MLLYIFILLFLLPFIDFWILFKISSIIGFWQTLAIVLLTGIVGAELVRREGRFVLEKLMTSVTAEEVSRNFIEGALLVLSGLLLIVPGLISDFLGALVLLRPLRERLVVKLSSRAKSQMNFEVRTF